MRRLLLALLLVTSPLSARDARPLRVLFAGNSLTYTNGLPAMVGRLAALDGRGWEIETVAQPNFSLADHLQSGAFRKTLCGRWDVVILQQGPSSLAESRRDLLRDTRTIAAAVREHSSSARIALLMVWPAARHAGSWDRVTESYRLAAEDVGGLVIPAGHDLRRALRADPSLKLLGADGFHPAVAGSYLATLTTYRALTGVLPSSVAEAAVARRIAGGATGLTDEQLRLLVRIAATPEEAGRATAPRAAR